jgi:hypothetical protein
MAASEALSPAQKAAAYRRWKIQTTSRAPMDRYSTTPEDAARFVHDNPEPGSYQDYDRGDYDYDDYGDGED